MLYPSAPKGLANLAYFPGTVKDIPCESLGDPEMQCHVMGKMAHSKQAIVQTSRFELAVALLEKILHRRTLAILQAAVMCLLPLPGGCFRQLVM